MKAWQDTDLWREVSARGAGTKHYIVLSTLMPVVEETLRAGVPSSPSFTLHDNEHGFRVAQLAAKLAGERTLRKLSSTEICLLLLAAYCHDIGMVPNRAKVRNHMGFLLTASNDLLTSTEQRDLQQWLDENWDGLTPPVEARLTSSGLSLAEEVNAYYCRSRHNDWSEDWIRTELNRSNASLYAGWVEDLVTLCRSHHEGLAQLRHERFDARLVGSPSLPLNLRFIAALLRTADVMEFAPERTPEVVLQHREVSPSSRIYWYKDHSIAFSLDNESGSIIFSAATPSAVIHKAVLMTAEWVDRELATCSTLDQEGAFKRGTIPESERSKYQWRWAARLTTDIRERDNSFVYIDGSFRPDNRRVLKLLSGTALYGTPIVAIRELLQNAIDAVKEQIAYERLGSRDASDLEIATALCHVHTIRLTFYRDDEGYWVRCQDDGSGMTKAIVESSLLISGSKTRPDLTTLERDSVSAGFSVGRTGKFGIGVLSYFMIAEKIVVLTRRSGEAGDVDQTAWRFVTTGIGGFGELRKESRGSHGTEVALQLRSEIVEGEPAQWFDAMATYVSDVVRWLPCRLELQDEIRGLSISRGPGWAWLPQDLEGEALGNLIPALPEVEEVITSEEEMKRSALIERNLMLRERAREVVNWMGPEEFDVDGHVGAGRVWLPYFDLPGGACFAFLPVDDRFKMDSTNQSSAYIPRYSTHRSWQGILVPGSAYNPFRCIAEVDYRVGKTISVDRHSFVGDDEKENPEGMSSAAGRIWRRFIKEHATSLYHEFNVMHSPFGSHFKKAKIRRKPHWVVRMGLSKEKKWRKIAYPIFDLDRISFYLNDTHLFSLNDVPINEAGWWTSGQYSSLSHRLYELYGGGDLVHYAMSGGYGFIGIRWAASSEMTPYDGTVGSGAVRFPDEWQSVAVIVGTRRPIFNKCHWLTGLAGSELAAVSAHVSAEDISGELERAILSPQRAAAFVISKLSGRAKFWIYLRDKHSELYKSLLRTLGVESGDQLVLAWNTDYSDQGTTIDLYEAAYSRKQPSLTQHLPVTDARSSLKEIKVQRA